MRILTSAVPLLLLLAYDGGSSAHQIAYRNVRPHQDCAPEQVAREIDFHGREQRYEYDGSGLCVKRVNGAGEETALERVRRQTDNYETEWEWDANGQVSALRADSGLVL